MSNTSSGKGLSWGARRWRTPRPGRIPVLPCTLIPRLSPHSCRPGRSGAFLLDAGLILRPALRAGFRRNLPQPRRVVMPNFRAPHGYTCPRQMGRSVGLSGQAVIGRPIELFPVRPNQTPHLIGNSHTHSIRTPDKRSTSPLLCRPNTDCGCSNSSAICAPGRGAATNPSLPHTRRARWRPRRCRSPAPTTLPEPPTTLPNS
jgi:hypothetical protein